MDKLQAMHVFTRVVDTHSFSGAADSLHMTRSSVTTIIQNLESALKVRLLNRTTRRISLTPDGAAYYERCARILADIAETENSFSHTANAPRGKLKVDLPGAIGRMLVVPALEHFQSQYPEIDVMLGVSDRPVDLIQDSVDCAVRMGHLEDSTLVARRVGTAQFVTVASPEYLARRGRPASLADLEQHEAVNYFSSRTGRIVEMDFVVDGKPLKVRMRSRLAANEGDAYLQCGLRGLGLIQIPEFVARPSIEKGELLELLPQWRRSPYPVSTVYPQSRHLSPQVRVFVDWVAELIEGHPLLSTNNEAANPFVKASNAQEFLELTIQQNGARSHSRTNGAMAMAEDNDFP